MTNAEKALLRQAASLWGRLGGSVSSEAKAAAARENGKKGGRPRKERCLDCKHRNDGRCVGVGAWAGHPPCYGFERKSGVQGAKSPRLKRAAEQSPREARPSKQKKCLH